MLATGNSVKTSMAYYWMPFDRGVVRVRPLFNHPQLYLSTSTGKNIDAATSMAVDAPECNIHLLTDTDKTGRSAMRFTAKLC